MTFDICPATTLGELQAAFNAAFPYLKIAFFRKSHPAHSGSPINELIAEPNKTVAQAQPAGARAEGRLFLEPSMEVWQAERIFEEEFGLHVQVFRKSGSVWLETARTDDQTLAQQNARGQALDQPIEAISDEIDYREHE